MPDVVAMQREHEDRLRLTTRWLIAETKDGYEVHEFTADGVATCAVKPIREAPAARLLQLMGIKHAIVPQNYPERIGISTITDRDGIEHHVD